MGGHGDSDQFVEGILKRDYIRCVQEGWPNFSATNSVTRIVGVLVTRP